MASILFLLTHSGTGGLAVVASELTLGGSFFTKNNKKYVNIFKNQDSSLLKNLSLANCLVKVPAKKITLKNDFLEIYELNNGL